MSETQSKVRYSPGPADGALAAQEGDKWTVVLVRELRHSPEKVWRALTDSAELRERAPFNVDANLIAGTTVNLTWVGAPAAIPIAVTRSDAPKSLEYNDTKWELEPIGEGTRLTLWASIDHGYIAMGAAGWHISLDVLSSLLDGASIGRIAGGDAMKFEGWQRLNAEYGALFGVKPPSWS